MLTIHSPHRVIAAVALAAACMLGLNVHAQEGDVDWPPLYRIGTPGTVTGSFASTNGWAPMLEDRIGKTVRVIPVDSENNRYIRLTQQDQLDLASVSVAEVTYQIQGRDSYVAAPANPMRIVWHHNDTPWTFFVRGDSEYQSIDDLKQDGVRVAVAGQSPAMTRTVRQALPLFLGMTPEEAADKWEFVPVGSYAENCRSVTDGKADIAWCSPISSVITEMEGHPEGVRTLDLPTADREAWSRWLEVAPTAIPTEINIGASSAQGVEGLTSNFLYWTRPEMDDDLVYNLAKWFHTNYDEYKKTHFLATRMSLEQFREYLDRSPLPVHEGTIRYLREIGAWTEEDDKWNQAAVERMNRWLQARKKAFAEAEERGVSRHRENQAFLDIVDKHTEGLEIFKTRGIN